MSSFVNEGGCACTNGCKCSTGEDHPVESMPTSRSLKSLYLIIGAAGVFCWWMLYRRLPAIADFMTYTIVGLSREGALGASVQFFLYDTPKVMLLLVAVVFGVGIIRTFFSAERTRALLSGRTAFTGNVMAALLGIVTPFCSCSAVPLFIGFVTAGVPLGVTFSFLIAAPMVNEIALGLLYGLLGWKVAGIYLATGLSVAGVSGWLIGCLHLEHYVEDWVGQIRGGAAAVPERLTWGERISAGKAAVTEIVGRVWIYVILGIAVGALIHGYVPENIMASLMGKNAWWSVPLAVVMGIPMYSNAAGIVPVVEALLGKGAALGTTLAFMMSVIALSLPEVLILRKVLKPRLIFIFLGVVGSGILLVGYLFNFLIPHL